MYADTYENLPAVSFTSLTNLPSLGSLAILNDLSYTSLLNLPSLGSLAPLNSVTQEYLPSNVSFTDIYSSGIVVSTATMTQLNSGVYNLYETGVQKAIFDGTFGGRFRANASGEAFLFEYYKQLSMTNNNGQEVFKIDNVNTIFNLNNFYVNTGTLYFGNANATIVNLDTLNTITANATTINTNELTVTAEIEAGNGTAALPAYSFVNDPDTGMFRQGTNAIGFATNGTEDFRITDTQALSVNGGTAALPAFSFSLDNDIGMFRPATNTLGFATAGAEAVRITSTNRLGVNTTNPAGQGDIRQTSATGAIPALYLNQVDLSEEFIQFQTTIGAGNPIIASSTATTFSHKIRVSVNGTIKWLYAYNA
jgi:hypothetical protein